MVDQELETVLLKEEETTVDSEISKSRIKKKNNSSKSEDFEAVLLKREEAVIDSEVSKLRSTRENNYSKLEGFKTDFTAYQGGKFLYVDLVAFIQSEDPKSFLIDRFVKDQKLGDIPIRPDKLEEFLDIPSYDHLLKHQAFFKDWTREQLDFYYHPKDRKFVAPSVTISEKEEIIERHSFYAKSEFALKKYNEINGFCETWNMLVLSGNVASQVQKNHVANRMSNLGMTESIHKDGKYPCLRFNYRYLHTLNGDD